MPFDAAKFLRSENLGSRARTPTVHSAWEELPMMDIIIEIMLANDNPLVWDGFYQLFRVNLGAVNDWLINCYDIYYEMRDRGAWPGPWHPMAHCNAG